MLRWSGFELHFGPPRRGMDPSIEDGGTCLLMVDSVAPYYAAFSQALNDAIGRVPVSGQRPRLTRFRPGATRFTIVDPSGNSVIVVQRDEPEELEYGGSKQLHGLARVLDNARILRDFKNDDRAAWRALRSGLRRHGEQASALDRARTLAQLTELTAALEEHDEAADLVRQLRPIELSDADRRHVESELHDPASPQLWSTDT